MPIPPSSTAIHGIGDRDVKDAPTFKDVASELARFLEGCDLAGYNITGFDLPTLRIEFLRAEVPFSFADRRIVDAQRIFFAKGRLGDARFCPVSRARGAHGA
jgi:DNA polymerase-3 subunit epsilon